MARIEGYISKKNVKRWLENYQALEHGDQLPNPEGVSINAGPKSYDGVSGGRMNKIMLDKALADLRQEMPFSWRCVLYRWVKPVMRREALQLLGVKSAVYARGCEEAVDYVYNHVNGKLNPYMRLMDAINGKR